MYICMHMSETRAGPTRVASAKHKFRKDAAGSGFRQRVPTTGVDARVERAQVRESNKSTHSSFAAADPNEVAKSSLPQGRVRAAPPPHQPPPRTPPTNMAVLRSNHIGTMAHRSEPAHQLLQVTGDTVTLVLMLATCCCFGYWVRRLQEWLKSERRLSRINTDEQVVARLCQNEAEDSTPGKPSSLQSGAAPPTALQVANELQSSTVVKGVALLLLVFQISGFYLLVQYTRSLPGEQYDSLFVVLLIELVKAVMCLVMHAKDSIQAGGFCNSLGTCFGLSELFGPGQRWNTLLCAIPATCYAAQNNLTFIAIENLSAVVAQVLAQTKTLTAAVASVLLIGRRFSGLEWLSFVLLVVSVCIVVVHSQQGANTESSHAFTAAGFSLGVGAALVASMLSGFAGVFIELMFTKKGNSIWFRNLQLGLYTIPQQCVALIYRRYFGQGSKGPQPSLLVGFHESTIAVILVQAFGGLLVSSVTKYAGSMPKTFAGAVGLVATAVLAAVCFDKVYPQLFWLGVLGTVLATILYNEAKSAQACLTRTCNQVADGPITDGRIYPPALIRRLSDQFLKNGSSEPSMPSSPVRQGELRQARRAVKSAETMLIDVLRGGGQPGHKPQEPS